MGSSSRYYNEIRGLGAQSEAFSALLQENDLAFSIIENTKEAVSAIHYLEANFPDQSCLSIWAILAYPDGKVVRFEYVQGEPRGKIYEILFSATDKPARAA
jgi:hypothetical protein